METWIFRGNPNFYDVTGAVGTLRRLTWRTTRFAKLVQRGDRVYIFENGTGIVAVANVIGDPCLREDEPGELAFIRNAVELSQKQPPKALLEVIAVPNSPLTLEMLRSDPRLAGLSILRSYPHNVGTNHKVDAAQAAIIESMLG